MTHVCRYVDGECELCVDEAAGAFRRDLLSIRGRYLVVDDAGNAMRFRSKTRARGFVGLLAGHGIKARLLRWLRDRVHLANTPFAEYEASDKRWWP